jgi:hemerythrin-like domain-containing protein
MRRHPALRDLSSEHHAGLVLVRRARRAAQLAAPQAAVAWQEVRHRFYGELEAHFTAEEQGLLPALREAGETALVERTLREHAALRALIADRQPRLQQFAEMLGAHIRFEERELFETAQRLLDDQVLRALTPSDA